MLYETNPAAETAVRFINRTDRHIFLTGKAGSGKTTFLKQVTDRTYKRAVVAAPTGIAAINAQGVTLHSLFQLPFGAFAPSDDLPAEDIRVQINTPKSLLKSLKMNTTKRNLLRELELLIIDEVSMLRADLLDAIDTVLRSVRRRSDAAFGGLQILFIGDLLQLPPVIKREEAALLSPWYPDLYFFNALALANNPPVYIELEKIYRQSDKVFISLLNNLRENRMTDGDVSLLNRYYDTSFDPESADGHIFITTHNKKADDINARSMKKLPGKSLFFDAEIEGDFPPHLFPVENRMELKKNAQVMFVKNDYSGEARYFNGKIGKIRKLTRDEIVVAFPDGAPPAEVDPYVWENKRYSLNKDSNEIEEEIIGKFTQYPLRAAWAVTVHKSQGLTFDKAVIDVSRAFAPGQIYVALSRLTSLDGLVLSAPLPERGLRPDRCLLDFAETKPEPDVLDEELETQSHRYLRRTALDAYDFRELAVSLAAHVNSYAKDEAKSEKQKNKAWAIALFNDTKPLKEVADKFQGQLAKITAPDQGDCLPLLHERLLAAKGYFEPLFDQLLKRVRTQIASMLQTKKTKQYLTELSDLERLYFKRKQLVYKSEALVSAAIQNIDLTAETLKKCCPCEIRERVVEPENFEDSAEDGRARTKDKKKKERERERDKEKPEKEDKIDTKKISLQMFEDGKDLGQIAKERGLSVSTVEGHMAHFIGRGELEIGEFLSQEQVGEILSKAEAIGSIRFPDLKIALENKYSYGQLKMALAHKQLSSRA